jgi:hypothetical protein
VRQWPQVQALLCPRWADNALTTTPEPSPRASANAMTAGMRAATSTDLSIRQIQSKIAGRASRGIVGEITKRARTTPLPGL